MCDELLEIIKRYLSDMAERGDHEADKILNMIEESSK